MIVKNSGKFAALLSLLAATVSAAFAQPLSYGQNVVQVKAGVLLIESQRVGAAPGQPYNPVPHHWHMLDLDRTIKPASWSFINPLGQSTFTDTMGVRWAANPLAGGLPNVGDNLSKATGSYWEVKLSEVSDVQLAQFDILSLSVAGTLALNSTEREKLSKYIDGGGVLWIDLVNEGGLVVDPLNSPPYAFATGASAVQIDANLYHPMLTFPNPMTIDDVRATTYPAVGPTVINFSAFPGGAFAGAAGNSNYQDFIAGNAAGGTISVVRSGDGYQVVTARGVTATLNRGKLAISGSPAQPNRGFLSLAPVQDASFYASAKFAINLIWLSSASMTSNSGSRKTGSVAADVPGPAMERFVSEPVTFDAERPAALSAGRVVTVAGTTIAVFDANPGSDLDGDGNPDDGEPDPTGSGRDMVWASSGDGGRLSAPTVVDVPRTLLGSTKQIWVTSSSGNVLVYDLTAPNGLNVPPMATIAPPTGGAIVDPAGLGPFAPTVHEGLVYIADTRVAGFGRIWACNLNTAQVMNTGGSAWAIQATARLPEVGSAPTVGYIPIQDSSGGVDRVLYQATLPSAPSRPAGLSSLWIGAKGEAPTMVRKTGDRVRLQTRAALNGLPIIVPAGASHVSPRVTMVYPNGQPVLFTQINTVMTGDIFTTATNGELEVELTAGAAADSVVIGGITPDYDGTRTPGDPTDDIGWRVDYTIDWSRAIAGTVASDSYVRGNLEFPDSSANTRRVLGSPVMTSAGRVIVVTTPPSGPGGTVFNLREEGRGDFALISRFDLFDQHSFTINGGTTTRNVPALFNDEDELLNDIPFLAGPLTGMRFVGTPSVRGDVLYLMAAGNKSIGFGNIPTSVLMALEANPAPIEFEVLNSVLAGGDQMSLGQADFARSTNKVNLDSTSRLGRNRFNIDPILNSNRSKISIASLMSVTRGTIRDSISTSQPIILSQNVGTDYVIDAESSAPGVIGEPGHSRGRFSPLLWYTVMNGFQGTAGPVTAGSTVYMGGNSLLPDVVMGVFPPSSNGLTVAMSADISPNDTFLKANTVRPYQSQLNSVKKNSAAPFDFDVSPAMRWPQIAGVRSTSDFRIRILQAAMPDPGLVNLAVGDGTVAATSASRLYAYTKSEMTVIDEGRLVRLDPVGNPLWTLTQTYQGGTDVAVTNATVGRKFSSPTRAYPAGNGSWWVVDSGNNRVILIDAAGREQRTVTNFRVHPNYTPGGYRSGETTDLRLPMDVSTFTTRRSAAEVSAIFPGESLANAATPELWRHIVIADAGNYRTIEIVDRFRLDASGRNMGVVQFNDPNAPGRPIPAYGILVWHTPDELSGRRFAYNSIDRTFLDDGNPATPLVPAIAFGFSNLEPGRGSLGLDSAPQDLNRATGDGGVVVYSAGQTYVINSFNKPAIGPNILMTEDPVGSGMYQFTKPGSPAKQQGITGLRSISVRAITVGGADQLAVMITDATGIYELVQNSGDPNQWDVNWMMPKEVYLNLRREGAGPAWSVAQLGQNPGGFVANYARRLDNDDVLIVNSYTGTYFDTSRGLFNGEVLIVEGSTGVPGPHYQLGAQNFGFNELAIKYAVPPMQGARGLMRPVFAARQ